MLIPRRHTFQRTGRGTCRNTFHRECRAQDGHPLCHSPRKRLRFHRKRPQEGAPQRFTIQTAPTDRAYSAYGSRATNPYTSGPTANVYIHASSGQTLSGSETRNHQPRLPGPSRRHAHREGLLRHSPAHQTAERDHNGRPARSFAGVPRHQRDRRAPKPCSSRRTRCSASKCRTSRSASNPPRQPARLTHREAGRFHRHPAAAHGDRECLAGAAPRGRTDEALVLTARTMVRPRSQARPALCALRRERPPPRRARRQTCDGDRGNTHVLESGAPRSALGSQNIPAMRICSRREWERICCRWRHDSIKGDQNQDGARRNRSAGGIKMKGRG